MHRTQADGATGDFKYTTGNAGLGIPATVVDEFALNSWQEELCLLVERYGLTLLSPELDTFTQVYQAIEVALQRGGRPAPIIQSIVNNQAAAADVAGFPNFAPTVVRSIEFLFTITRKTDTNQVIETGRKYLTWNPTTLAWVPSRISVHDDAGVTFSTAIVAGNVSKLQYVSSNIAGSSYAGTLTITDIKELRV